MASLNTKITHWIDRRVWVIGASSGIGEALCSQFQQRGAKLILSARNTEKLNAIAQPDDLVIPLNVQIPTELVTAGQTIQTRWGGVDLVIYCAGVYHPMKSTEIELESCHEAMAVNLGGVYNMLSSILPGMLSRGDGAVCLIASVAGLTGLPNALAYGPTKAAMINLAQILYTELSDRGIGVFLVNPGFVDTRQTQKNTFQMPALITPPQAASAIIEGVEKGRFEIHFPRRFSYLVKMVALLPGLAAFSPAA